MAETLESLSGQIRALGTSVDEHFAEQRAYTEFGYERLEKAIGGRLDTMDGRLDTMNGRFDTMDGRFDRLERKLDQFIETQLQTNQLVDRRLRALEPPEQGARS